MNRVEFNFTLLYQLSYPALVAGTGFEPINTAYTLQNYYYFFAVTTLFHILNFMWSNRRESNPRIQLGRMAY